MNLVKLLILVALFAPVVWLFAHLDRSGPRLTLRELAGALSSFGYRFAEAGDLTIVSATAVSELEAKERGLLERAKAIANEAEKSETGDFTAEQRGQVKALIDEAKTVREDLAKAKGDQALLDYIAANDGSIATDPAGIKSRSKGTVGERFVKDADVGDYLKKLTGNKGGFIAEKTRVHTDAVQFAGLKDILSSGTVEDVGGPVSALVNPDFRGLLDVGTWQRPLTIRDLVSSGTTTSDTVHYARMLDVVNNAAPVAEASGSSAGDASGDVTGAKPESSIELEPVSETVKTIAHWIPMTKRALSDVAQIRTLIDTFLRYGLEEELEDQMVNGDGTGENFEGILEVDGTQTQAFDTDILKTLRKAKTKAQVGGRGRNLAFIVNPEDDEAIDLMQDGNERYLGNGPFGAPGQDTVWGMRRVVSEAVDAGQSIVGDWRWAILWDREQAGVQLSDQHADFFTRNLVAALAELRAAFGVIRPAAFVITDTQA